MKKKALITVNVIIVVLEVIAFLHDCFSFGLGIFQWYTVDSNVLQLIVSCMVLWNIFKYNLIPKYVINLHFISAVGLTVTFLIAAFVLAPEGGIEYYFLSDVAPINHFIGPLLSVISLLFLEKVEKLPIRVIVLPVMATLIYGMICLVLNILRILNGPYFFLQVYEQSATTIALWFAIIAILCIGLAFLYYKVKWK